MTEHFLEVTQEAGAALFSRKITGKVVMLNLLRFRDVADYSANPELMPNEPISGAEAYQKYIDHALPFLRKSSGILSCLSARTRFLTSLRSRQIRSIWRVWDIVPPLWKIRVCCHSLNRKPRHNDQAQPASCGSGRSERLPSFQRGRRFVFSKD